MLFAITEALSSIRDFMEQGGNVLWLIAILVFFMWGMIFERIWYLSHAHQEYVADLAEKWNSRNCLLYTSPSPRDRSLSRMPSSA